MFSIESREEVIKDDGEYVAEKGSWGSQLTEVVVEHLI